MLPHANGRCMRLFLGEVAARRLGDRIIMVLDGAGRHQNRELTPPKNLRLPKLPPYSPELKPAEHPRDELREKSFPNLVSGSPDALEGHPGSAPREMGNDIARVKPIVAWPWVIETLVN